MALLRRRRASHSDCSVHGPLLPEDVLAKTFKVHRVSEGYDANEVDDFLDRVAAAMAGFAPAVSAWDIRQHEFVITKRFRGICPEDVDDFLECIAQTLEGRAGYYLIEGPQY